MYKNEFITDPLFATVYLPPFYENNNVKIQCGKYGFRTTHGTMEFETFSPLIVHTNL